jgi:large-conductance mechanosensitive channel
MKWFIIIFFIISIFIFIVTKYYYLKKKLEVEQIESFENENSLTTTDKLLKYHGLSL